MPLDFDFKENRMAAMAHARLILKIAAEVRGRELTDIERIDLRHAAAFLFRILERPGEVSYTCPKCAAVSHNPNDVANHYCVACHVFEGDSHHGP
jgi:hypothetical protein